MDKITGKISGSKLSTITGKVTNVIDSADLQRQIDELKEKDVELFNLTNGIKTDLHVEITNRINDVEQLLEKINTETSDREAADEDIKNTILEGIDERIQNIRIALQSEVDRAKTAENQLDTKIQTEKTRATAKESEILGNITSETARALEAESILNDKIDSEETRATEAEDAITDRLELEIQNRILDVYNEKTRATNKETELTNDLSSETTRATGAEGVLDTKIESEITNRQEAVSSEATTRQNADIDLQNQIELIKFRTDVADIVTTKASLLAYDTTKLTDKDIIKVLVDESEGNASTYYRWIIHSGAGTWNLIGSEGPYVALHGEQTIDGAKTFTNTLNVITPTTNSEAANKEYVDTADALKADKIGPLPSYSAELSDNVLDFIHENNLTGKGLIISLEHTGQWIGQLSNPGPNIVAFELERISDKYRYVGTIQDGTNTTFGQLMDTPYRKEFEEETNKVTSLSTSSTNTQYPSAKLVYDQLALKVDKEGPLPFIQVNNTDSSLYSILTNYNIANKSFILNSQNYWVLGKASSSGGNITFQFTSLTEPAFYKATNVSSSLTINQIFGTNTYKTNYEAIENKVTSISASSTDVEYPSAKAVWTLVDNLPKPMLFKGSVGDGGTVEWIDLPVASTDNDGWTYKVITDHAIAPICKVGDTIISNSSSWVVIPSGDEPKGTVTSVGLSMPTGFSVANSPITSSGTLMADLVSGYSLLNSNSTQTIAGNKVFTDRLYFNNNSPANLSADIGLNSHTIRKLEQGYVDSLNINVSGYDAPADEYYLYRADLGSKGFSIDKDFNHDYKAIFHVDDNYLYTNADGIHYEGDNDDQGWETNTTFLQFPNNGGTIATTDDVNLKADKVGELPHYTVPFSASVLNFIDNNDLNSKPIVLYNEHGGPAYIGMFRQVGLSVYHFEFECLINEARFKSPGGSGVDLTGLSFYNIFTNEYKHPYEVQDNKVTSDIGLSASSTDTEYPSAKAVYDFANLIEITYSDLKLKRDNSQLILGRFYRITDYECTTTTANTSSAGHQFDIIVLALSDNLLSEEAYAAKHDGDTYFANNKLEAWKLWYCLDNDTNRFAWADSTNGKGVIYRMIDEFGNDCPYDFKNILFTGSSYDGSSTYTDVYTFTYKENSIVKDASLLLTSNIQCYNNTMKEYIDSSSNRQQLNFNVVYTSSNFHCYSNTLGNDCYHNTFKNGTFYNNIFNNNCYNNTLGGGCYDNIFNNNCHSNTLGTTNCSNIFGNSCFSNKLGNNCRQNIFNNICHNNIFGNSCSYNKLGNNCYNNTFGNNFSSNILKDSCKYIVFGTRSDSTNMPEDYCSCNIIDTGCGYITIHGNGTASVSNALKNIHIHLGVTGTSSEYKTIIVDRGLSYLTEFKPSGSVVNLVD